MLGYILFFLFVLLVDSIHLSNKRKILLAFFIIFIFTGFRYGIGFDYFTYCELMKDYNYSTELIPTIFMNIARETHFSLFFILSALWTCSFFAFGLRNNISYDSVIFYICMPALLLASMSIVRQCMAYSVIFLIVSNVNMNKIKKIILIFIAFLCHSSSLIAIFYLFPIHRIKKKMLWILFIASFFCGEAITKVLLSINSGNPLIDRLQFYLSGNMGGGTLLRVILYLLTVASLVYYDRLKQRGYSSYVSIVCLGCSFYSLFTVNAHLAERTCMFFFPAILFYIHDLRLLVKMPKLLYNFLFIVIFSGYVYIAHCGTLENNPFSHLKASLYYPYETVFGK